MTAQNKILAFTGALFLAAYFSDLAGLFSQDRVHPLWNAVIGVFLICLAGFGIETTKRLQITFGERFSIGIKTERYKPTTEQETVAVRVSADALKPGEEPQRDELVEAAKSRSADERSAAVFRGLGFDLWGD